MTLARSCSPEDLARLGCVPAAVRQHPRYAGDHAIRYYRERPYTALLADLGWDPDTPLVAIRGGIGRLVLGPPGVVAWEPETHRTADAGEFPLVTVTDAATSERRLRICRACGHYRAGNDQCGLCGCGFVVSERVRSAVARCPAERW